MRYALLRDTLGDESEPREIDLLVWPQDRARFRAAAAAQGFFDRPCHLPLKEVLAAYDGEVIRLLDVHYAFVQRGLVYLRGMPDESRLVRTRAGHRQLGSEDRLLHLFFHSLLGKQGLQEKHRASVDAILAGSLDRAYLNARLENPRVRELFERFHSSPESFLAGCPEAAAMAHELTRQTRASSLANRRRALLLRLRERFRCRRTGTLVAFVGVDGAGKTTTIENVRARLERAGGIRFCTIYMGPWGQYRGRVLPWALRHGFSPPEVDWLRRLRARIRHGALLASAHCLAKWIKGRIRGWAYYGAVSAEMWHRYMREIRPARRRGELVLCDRYVVDLRHIFIQRRMRLFRLSRRLVCLLFPSPDLIVFLNNDPDVIAGRKAQLDAERIRAYQELYRSALARHNVLDARTDRLPDELAEEITRRFLALHLGKR